MCLLGYAVRTANVLHREDAGRARTATDNLQALSFQPVNEMGKLHRHGAPPMHSAAKTVGTLTCHRFAQTSQPTNWHMRNEQVEGLIFGKGLVACVRCIGAEIVFRHVAKPHISRVSTHRVVQTHAVEQGLAIFNVMLEQARVLIAALGRKRLVRKVTRQILRGNADVFEQHGAHEPPHIGVTVHATRLLALARGSHDAK